MKAFTLGAYGWVACDQCGRHYRCGPLWEGLIEWQREHRKTCPLKRPSSRRAASERNGRGSAEDRRRRKTWLVEHWRADVDLPPDDKTWILTTMVRGSGVPACRCWECGKLLTVKTVIPDRIVPGCEGGTYRRENLRPHCKDCSERQGGQIGQERKR